MVRRRRKWRREAGPFAIGAAVGAALAFLMDPERGRHRRRLVRERSAGGARHAARRCARRCRATVLRAWGHTKGLVHRMRPRRQEPLDDVELAHKVESVLFRNPGIPKGEISINAENGAVFLRGQLERAELIDDVADAVRRIPGVGEVVNLLHVPGTKAPHAPAPARLHQPRR